MLKWNFVSRRFLQPYHKVYDELCAPATLVLGDSLLVIGSTYAKDFTLWYSQQPQKDTWKEAVHAFTAGAWDPAFLWMMINGFIYTMALAMYIRCMARKLIAKPCRSSVSEKT